jgi:hypothetical protein
VQPLRLCISDPSVRILSANAAACGSRSTLSTLEASPANRDALEELDCEAPTSSTSAQETSGLATISTPGATHVVADEAELDYEALLEPPSGRLSTANAFRTR